jgi:transcription antitermination factor NusG
MSRSISVKSLYPSEDGEALFQSSSTRVSTDSDYSVEGLLPTTPDLNWFAVYTTCRHEKRVSEHLTQREIEHFLPVYLANRKWRDGSKVALQLPLFPCYLFVRIPRSARSRVLSVPGALAIVGGTGRESAPLADSAIRALQKGVEERRVEPHPLLTAGHRVRIRSGPFTGMTGVITRRKSGFRVVLTLAEIMQSVAVEVDEHDLGIVESNLCKLNLQFA